MSGQLEDDCGARTKRNAAPLCQQNRGLQLEAYYGFILRGIRQHVTRLSKIRHSIIVCHRTSVAK